MSDAMMTNLANMAESMSYDEILSAISLFIERLKRPFSVAAQPKVSKEKEAITKLLDLANSLHLTSNGRDWTREELYER